MKKVRNILVLTYWSYQEALIQTYTLPYVKIIRDQLEPSYKVYLVTQEKDSLELSVNDKKKLKLKLRDENIHWIDFSYTKFGPTAFLKWIYYIAFLVGLSIFQNISHIHAWCTPAGMIGYIISILTGKPLILDSYEPHAESMVENGDWKKSSVAFRILFEFEKRQSKRAEHIISATASMKEYMWNKYAVIKHKFHVKPACVDLALFTLEKKKNENLLNKLKLRNKIVAIYAGKLGGIYLQQEIFDFLKVASDFWGSQFHFLILTNEPKEKIVKLSKASNFPIDQLTQLFVPHSQIPDYLGLGDFALTPVKPVPTKKYCTPIKDGEYWALGLPVIITKDISVDSDIIRENKIGAVLENFAILDYSLAVNKIDKLLNDQDLVQIQNKIREIAMKHRNFEMAKTIYSQIYAR